MTTKEVVSEFAQKVGDNDHTLDELKKLLTEVYKNKTKKKSSGVKKEPSAYNIFVKEEIARIKEKNPNIDHKKFMSMAAEKWKEHKEKNNL